MEDKDLIWLPKSLVEKLKKFEPENEAIEREVLKYIKDTEHNISDAVQNLDDDVLQFKAKLSLYKKSFKEAYESADSEMYSFWEDFDNKLYERYKSMDKRLSRINKIYQEEFDKKKDQIEQLSKSMESLNTYQFERVITFLKAYQNLDPNVKELFNNMVKNQ